MANEEMTIKSRKADRVCEADPLQASLLESLKFVCEFNVDNWNMDRHLGSVLYQAWHRPDQGDILTVPMVAGTITLQMLEPGFTMPRTLKILAGTLVNPDHGELIAKSMFEFQECVTQGWKLFGIGVGSFGLSVDEKVPDAERLLRERVTNGTEHPDVRHTFHTRFVTVGSRIWDVLQRQGEDISYATTGPDEPAEPTDVQAPLEDSLARMVQAYVEVMS